MNPWECFRVFFFGDEKLTYWNHFLDKLVIAARAATAILIVSAIVEYAPKEDIEDGYFYALSTFGTLVAINAGERTLGKLIENVFMVSQISVLNTCLILLTFQFIKPPFKMGVTLTCIGVGSFLIAYPSRLTLMSKKVGLSQIVVTAIHAHLKPLDVVHQPIHTLGSIVVGFTAALVAYCLPFPRLGVFQVKHGAHALTTFLNELLRTLTRGFTTDNANSLYSACVRTGALRKSASEHLKYLQSIQADLWWEYKACCSLPALENLISGLKKLDLHIAGMEFSLQSKYLLEGSLQMRESMKESMELLREESNHLLAKAVGMQGACRICCLEPPGSYETEESREALYSFDETFLYARKMTYYRGDSQTFSNMMHESSCILEGLTMRNITSQHISTDTDVIQSTLSRNKFMIRATTYFFIFNLRIYMEQAMQLVDPYYRPLRERRLSGLRKWIPGLEQHLNFYGDSTKSSKFEISEDTESPSSGFRDDLENIVCNVCTSNRVQAELDSRILYKIRKTLKSWLTPNTKQLKFALKISVALILATLFGSLDLPHDAHQAWAATTVCYIIASGYHRGGAFHLSLQRFLGTTVGAIFGYLATRGSGDKRYIIMIVITLWTFCTNVVKQSEAYRYCGDSAGITAVVMMLGDEAHEVQEYAVGKITQTFIGIFTYMLVEMLIFPYQARTVVKEELAKNILSLKNTVADVVNMYTGVRGKCLECRNRRVEEIKQLERELGEGIAHQVHMQEEADHEPNFWWVPFPSDVYAEISKTQYRMLDLLLFMVCCLQSSTEDEYNEHMLHLLEPLQISLNLLKDNVTNTLDLLYSLLNDPRKGVHRDCCCCNISISFHSLEPKPEVKSQLQVLDDRKRTIGGTPLDLKLTMNELEYVHENVFEEIIQQTKRDGEQIISSSVMLSISSLSFCLHELTKESVQLEKAIFKLFGS